MPNHIGEFVRESREEKGYSQPYLGMRLGRTKSWVSKVEQGKITPDPDMVDQLAALFSWDEEQVRQAKRLLNGRSNSGKRDRLLANIKQRLERLEQSEPNHSITGAVVMACKAMRPLPTVEFLQFLDDALSEAIRVAGEDRMK